MAYNLREKAVDLADCAQRVYENVSSEVYGGDWTDSVGESYLAYAENISRYARGLADVCGQIAAAARNLNSFDAERDRAYISGLEAEVR